MKETREMEWFHKTVETLAVRQAKYRDDVLDSILTLKYEDADKKLKELQTLSIGLQLCQQTILRENDRLASEAGKAAQAESERIAQVEAKAGKKLKVAATKE